MKNFGSAVRIVERLGQEVGECCVKDARRKAQFRNSEEKWFDLNFWNWYKRGTNEAAQDFIEAMGDVYDAEGMEYRREFLKDSYVDSARRAARHEVKR